MKDETLPSIVEEFSQSQPAVWEAYNKLGQAVAEAGPLDAKTQRLVKLAIAVGAGREGAVRSHARRGPKEGLTPAELEHVAILGITTAGCFCRTLLDSGRDRQSSCLTALRRRWLSSGSISVRKMRTSAGAVIPN